MKAYTIECLKKEVTVYFKDDYRLLPPGHFVKLEDSPDWHEVIYDPSTDTVSVNGKPIEESKLTDRKHKSVPTHGMVSNYFSRREQGDSHNEAIDYAESYAPFTPKHVVEYYVRYYHSSMIKNWFDVKKEQSGMQDNQSFYYYRNGSDKIKVDADNYSKVFSSQELSKGIQLSMF